MHRRLLAIVLAASGCVVEQPRPAPAEPWEQLATALDFAERRLDEWGSVSVSAPLLAAPGPTFEFDLSDITARSLYESARLGTQGRSSLLDDQTLKFLLEGGTATPKGEGTAASDKSQAPPPQPPSPLKTPEGLTLPSRTALLTAAGDYTTKMMLGLYGDGAQLSQFRERPVLHVRHSGPLSDST